nr:MAG TPA: hypothetical protein [Bacteriophage sp.]
MPSVYFSCNICLTCLSNSSWEEVVIPRSIRRWQLFIRSMLITCSLISNVYRSSYPIY